MFPVPTYDGGVHHHFLQNVTHQKGEKFHWHTISLGHHQIRPTQQQPRPTPVPLKKSFTVTGALTPKFKLKNALTPPSATPNGKAPPSPSPASDTATLQGSYRSESATIVDVDDVLSSAPDSARMLYLITEDVISHIAAYHQTAPPTSSHSDPGLPTPNAHTGSGNVSPATAIWQIGELAAQIQSAVVPILTWNLYAVHETLEKSLRDTTDLLSVVLGNLKKWYEAQKQPQQMQQPRPPLDPLPESTSQPGAKPKAGRRLSLNFHLGKSKSPKSSGPSKVAMTLGLGKGATAARDLRENVEYLIKAHKALLDCAQVVIHVRPSASSNFVIPAPSLRGYVDHRGEQKMRSMMADVRGPSVYEAKNFWRRYIGDESEFADSEDFCSLLADWTDESLPKLEQQRLLLRLDPNHTGYISFSTFKSFVRNGKLRESVHVHCSDPPLPLLLWIDADVSRVVPQILEATALGIKVLQFASATGAKSWLRLNREFLKKNDSAAHIRILVNQVLFERHDDTHMPNVNDNAGQEVCAAVRDAGLSLPVLVYTTPDNIDATRWVKDFPQAGSVGGNHLVYTSYISALAAGKPDDSLWRRYNAP